MNTDERRLTEWDGTPGTFDAWAIVEVMGHSRFAGRVTEQAIGGVSFVRVDVPAVGDRLAFSKLLGASAIFAITPVSEEVARDAANRFRSAPLEIYSPSVQRQLGYDEDDY